VNPKQVLFDLLRLSLTVLNTFRLGDILLDRECKSLNYTVLIEQDEGGTYIAKVPDTRVVIPHGKSVKQAIERVKEAIQVCAQADEF